MENTPLFNSKIKEILSQLRPGERTCQETGERYLIREEDIAFYKRMLVPAPVVAPWVRQRNLLAHGSPPDELFKIKSALSGKEIITNIGPSPDVPVYAEDEWFSDVWDAADYGVDYKPGESFFKQFHALKLKVPRPCKLPDEGSINSPWAIGGVHMKDCYMVSAGYECENILYSASAIKSRDCMEIFFSDYCELGYQLFQCKHCYKSSFLDDCESCISCTFGFDLKNCENCFGCINLRHKKYNFFNQQLTKEEYENKMNGLNLGSRKELNEWQKKFNEFYKNNAIRENLHLKNTQNVVGDNLTQCNACYNCFDSYNIQDSANVFRGMNVRDSHDIMGGLNMEKSIGLCAVDSYNVKYCTEAIYNSTNLEYCELCYNLENCFGCVGLRNKKFHILNKPYSADEYWQLVNKIKYEMLASGEYGQILPLKYLIYGYNLTWANIIFPINEARAMAMKLPWHVHEKNSANNGLTAESLPDNIKEADSKIIGSLLVCSETGRLFKIVEQEFDFYKKMNLPLPVAHPLVRRQKLYKKLRTPILSESVCGNCNKKIMIRGSIESQVAKNVCGDCYLKIISS
ncbi:MAG: hypothetical protein PHC97_00445 [Patescibacteria group bacterium]|nr:hypothetical protein [Patescibacteria group bacterium]